VNILKNLLFKRKWFGRKKYRVMRRLSAMSLSQIASKQALEILNKGMTKRDGDIRLACELALKGRPK
jgi:hypothetical protein